MSNPAWVTNLLRPAYQIAKVECILHAKTTQYNMSGQRSAIEMGSSSSVCKIWNTTITLTKQSADPSLSGIRLRQHCRNQNENIDLPVQSLAGCYHGKSWKGQVRGVDQTPYQPWHSPLRWATSYAYGVAPLQFNKPWKIREEDTQR